MQADGGASDAELSRHDARHYAAEDLSHIETSRIFWLLAPETRTSGAWVEFGYAVALSHIANRGPGPLGQNRPQHIVASGAVEGSIFCACADEEHATDRGAFDAITAWGREQKEVSDGREKAPCPSGS